MQKVALITGAARRIGAEIARYCHHEGYNIAVHYRHSSKEAELLCCELNQIRSDSALALRADLNDTARLEQLSHEVTNHWGRLDLLVNNASSFAKTIIGQTTEVQWDELINSNVKGAYFLSQACATYLAETRGSIINITDVHASRPMRHYAVYCMAKAALEMMTQALAKELAPKVRVNAIAPGLILEPEGANALSSEEEQRLVSKTLLKKRGNPCAITEAVVYLANANYVTSQSLQVDGGKK